MTAQPDVTTRDGWLFDGHLPTGWEAYGDKCGVDGVPPCLVVTGNLDAARARLEAATPDDVRERAVGIVVGLSYLDPCDGGRIIDALADAGLLRGPETSSAAPEGAALSASGTVRRAGGPDHGTAPVGDDVKARAREAAYDAGLRPYSSYVHAGDRCGGRCRAAPSHLDRLAAWAVGAVARGRLPRGRTTCHAVVESVRQLLVASRLVVVCGCLIAGSRRRAFATIAVAVSAQRLPWSHAQAVHS